MNGTEQTLATEGK